jgi:hypothetical protein
MSTTTVDRTAGPDRDELAPTRAFSASMLISATRCLLTYVVFPWVLPALGVAGGVGPGVGLVVGAVALASNVVSIRRFWAADHRWKWPITALNVGVIALVSTFVADDITDLL